MNKSYILLGMCCFVLCTCFGQNIDRIRGTSWINIDYIKDMENYLPCECIDSINYYYYISIASKFINDDVDDEEKVPEGIVNSVIQTEPALFYILFADSIKYIIAVDSESKYGELTLSGDTLLLIDSISSKKFIKSTIPFDFSKNQYPSYLDNITLLNNALLSRGYPSIQTILEEDSLGCNCNAWLGNINMIYSYKTRKSWVLEIYNGFLHIYKITNTLESDPLDPILKKEIKRLKWVTNGNERQPRKKDYPVFVSPY
jgi:hypothetical protein